MFVSVRTVYTPCTFQQRHVARVFSLNYSCLLFRLLQIWDIASGDCIMTLHNAHSDAVTCVQFDEQRIISGSLDRCIKFWDLRTGRWITTLDWTQGEGHTGVIRSVDGWVDG